MQIKVLLVECVDPEAYLFECIFQNALEADLEGYAGLLAYLMVNELEFPSEREIQEQAEAIYERHKKWREETISEFREVIRNGKKGETP